MIDIKERLLCCGNCRYADGSRIKNSVIRCQKEHKYKELDDYCDDYDYGDKWHGKENI